AFINARTDVFLIAHPSEHTDEMVTTALERARAYADAGADGFFVPGLIDEGKIARVCAESPLPVNVMARPGATPPPRFAELGVARVSYGPHPYRIAMDALREAALAAQRSERSRQCREECATLAKAASLREMFRASSAWQAKRALREFCSEQHGTIRAHSC